MRHPNAPLRKRPRPISYKSKNIVGRSKNRSLITTEPKSELEIAEEIITSAKEK